jgi:hypothetical protein
LFFWLCSAVFPRGRKDRADCIAPSENHPISKCTWILLDVVLLSRRVDAPGKSGHGALDEKWINELHPTEVVPFFRTPGMYEGPLMRALLNCCLRLHLFFEQHLDGPGRCPECDCRSACCQGSTMLMVASQRCTLFLLVNAGTRLSEHKYWWGSCLRLVGQWWQRM